jgi:protein-disulfide isomerase
MRETVKWDVAEGNRLGVTSTPTFLFGRVGLDGTITLTKKLVGLPAPEDVDEVIATLLSQD